MWEAVTRLQDAAAACATTPVWALPDTDLLACLDAVHAAEQAVAAAKLHLIDQVQSRDLPRSHGASGITVWLRDRLRVSVHTARRLVELAAQTQRRPALDTAVSQGAANVEQVAVIAAAITALPTQVGVEVVDKAEQILIGDAAEFEPRMLAKLGTRILSHVAPEVAEQVDRAALDREQTRAYATREFRLSPAGDGRVRVQGWLDRAAAATVTAALDPPCHPRRDPAEDRRSPSQRRADALVEVCQLALRTEQLPEHGGQRPHLVVTVPYDVLRQQLGAGPLASGEPLPAQQVRRLPCDAAIIPAVLGTHSQVLDLGTARRLFTGPVRRALILRDGGCAFPSCDRPARGCDAHHLHPASLGGPTSLVNATLPCRFHPHVMQPGDWQVRIAADGLPEFTPPHYVDSQRRPRRNLYHRRP